MCSFPWLFPKKGKALVGVYVDLEAQGREDGLKYTFEQRATYYIAREISSQHGRDFVNSEYQKIKKVYSIWIVFNPLKERTNTIIRIIPEREVIAGQPFEDSTHDLHEIIIVRLCKENENAANELIGMLSLLFAPDIKPEEKKQRLTEKYDVPVTNKLRKELDTMCNLSQGLIDRGFELKAAEEENTTRKNVMTMHQDGLPLEKISKYSGRSIDEIRKWIEESES